MGETLNQQEIVTHVLDPRVHKRSHDPQTTKDDIKVAGLLREDVLVVFSKGGLESARGSSHEGVLNPIGSSPRRPRSLTKRRSDG